MLRNQNACRPDNADQAHAQAHADKKRQARQYQTLRGTAHFLLRAKQLLPPGYPGWWIQFAVK